MEIRNNFHNLTEHIPNHVQLVAVSKTKPINDIMEVYNEGQRHFGENKAQEMADKYLQLPKDINWHFIGHLQTNKVKYIAPFVHLIHSVDSSKLLIYINNEAKKQNRVINCLLQIYIATEESKQGFEIEEVCELLKSTTYKQLENICIVGLMGMATYTDNLQLISQEFHQLKMNFDFLKSAFFTTDYAFKEISMGMSGDYEIAIAEGSTIVRIGSSIFGERNYLFK